MADIDLTNMFARLKSVLSGPERTAALQRVGNRVGVLLERIAREAPERQVGVKLPKVYSLDGKPSKFKSRKQRAKVAILGKQGKIPHRRGAPGLISTITSEATANAGSVDVKVGTNYPNADKVIGPKGTQNRFLNSLGWEPLDERIERAMPEIRAEAARSTAAEIRRALKGR